MQSVNYQSMQITPSKIVCVGRNYLAHIKELGNQVPEEMVIFLKPNSAISENLLAQHQGEQLHYEAELAYLYQKGSFVAVALGLDLTKRGLQSTLKKQGLPWERAKAFDCSALFSDFVSIQECDEELTLSLTIDGEQVQYESNQLMMHKPNDILRSVQTWLTLVDGDIVMTGTPQGVGAVKVNHSFCGQVIRKQSVIVEKIWHSEES